MPFPISTPRPWTSSPGNRISPARTNVLGVLLALLITIQVLDGVSSWEPLPTMDEWKTWTLEELEKQMNPSRWNPLNLTSEQVIQQYIQSGLNGTALSRNTLAHSLNIAYGKKPAERLDFYGTDLPMDSPLFFWVHGGYWQEGSKDISGHFATVLRSWGFKTVVMGYTLAPDAGIEEIQEEVVGALKLVSDMYPTSKLVVGGHSAGGQLVSRLVTSKALLRTSPALEKQILGLYLVSGVYDLRPLVPTSINGPLKLTPEKAESLSALFNDVDPSWQFVPLKNFVLVGFYDSPEFQRQSTGYYEQLKSQFDTDFWVSQDDDHFSIVEKLADPTSEPSKKLESFLKQLTKNAWKKGSGAKAVLGDSTTASALFGAFSILTCLSLPPLF